MSNGFGTVPTDGAEEKQINEVDTSKYLEFVNFVTSDASKNYDDFAIRLAELNQQGVNIERLLTAAVGINAEGGEFMEIVKKMIFQGKPWNEDNKDHLITELGDMMWYVMQACIALEVPIDYVIGRNVEKLEKRYPGGAFDVFYSENRSEDDR